VTQAAWERARAAEAAAREQLAAVPSWLWDGTTLPVPVETLADSHYGLFVEEAPDLRSRLGLNGEAHLSGLLLPAERLIMVDAEEAGRAPGRRRFTITHELGHWVMHCSATSVEPVYCRDVSVREDPAPESTEPGDATVFLDYPPPNSRPISSPRPCLCLVSCCSPSRARRRSMRSTTSRGCSASRARRCADGSGRSTRASEGRCQKPASAGNSSGAGQSGLESRPIRRRRPARWPRARGTR
jgi:hypothetical protein